MPAAQGDGDFSFSLALARALRPERSDGGGSLVATSHESEASVLSVYPNAAETLAELRRLGVAVYHEVDATELQATLPPPHSFDRIVWNFPCIGRGLEAGHDGQNEQMDANKELVRRFGRSACALLRPGGEVHVGHKTKPPYNHWSIVEQVLARSELRHTGAVVFDRAAYPPYVNRKALGSKSFAATDALQYIFARPGAVPEPEERREGARRVLRGLSAAQRGALLEGARAGLDLQRLALRAQRRRAGGQTVDGAEETHFPPSLPPAEGGGPGEEGVCPLGYAAVPPRARGLQSLGWAEVVRRCPHSEPGAEVLGLGPTVLALVRASLQPP